MAWYDEAVFYHIYPLGLCGCAKENKGAEPSHFPQLKQWAKHAARLHCTALYIGPLFESVGHGYETTDYYQVDRRIGTNDEFKKFVSDCHELGLRVVVDGVFNHVGREFFAFKDVRENRQQSPYCNWFCNLNFSGNNEYNDGFSYENWGGYNLLVKLNQQNPEVQEYIFKAIQFWVSEFAIDGIRLDAADVLDHDFMRKMRQMTKTLKPDFWLMGEVIHGDYSRWVNEGMLHSVTNYELHKGLYSGHNDHNYFEIAHSVKRLAGICGSYRLYTFMDNHDVERIYSKLHQKDHLLLVMILVYTLYGIPSIYYGSEFGIAGKKEQGSDWNLRPCLAWEKYKDAYDQNPYTKLCRELGWLKKQYKELTYGDYKELYLTNRQYAYSRCMGQQGMVIALNCDDAAATFTIQSPVAAAHGTDLLRTTKQMQYENGQLHFTLPANRGTVIYLGEEEVQDVQGMPQQDVIESADSIAEASGMEQQQENACVCQEKEVITPEVVEGIESPIPLKVLLLNGSPHKEGSTATAIKEVVRELENAGIQTEVIQVGHLPIRSCTACKKCVEIGKCVIEDLVNETAEKLKEADGLVVASPVYYASANATLIAFLTRLFYSTSFDKTMKVGASIVSARRGGCSATFDELNKFFTISGMPVVSSQYWNSIHGNNGDEAQNDEEGLQVMRTLGKNMAFMLKSIELGKKNYGLPEKEPRISTNFIR